MVERDRRVLAKCVQNIYPICKVINKAAIYKRLNNNNNKKELKKGIINIAYISIARQLTVSSKVGGHLMTLLGPDEPLL